MKLYIKNMVSNSCKIIVKSELEKVGLHCLTMEIGLVEIEEPSILEQQNLLNFNLLKSGFGLLYDKKSVMIERIKNIIIELVHYSSKPLRINLSDYISEKLNYNYPYLAHLFSENQGITIEHFLLTHKIERIKELLIYNEMNLNEIANNLHYCSAAHLSNQFRKMTGMTTSDYKLLKLKNRKGLDTICQ